jgi:hypothetical protein
VLLNFCDKIRKTYIGQNAPV